MRSKELALEESATGSGHRVFTRPVIEAEFNVVARVVEAEQKAKVEKEKKKAGRPERETST